MPRLRLACALVMVCGLTMVGVTPAAGLDERCPAFHAKQVWFNADETVGNAGGVGIADHTGWDTTAPTGSVADGDGGRYVASRWGGLAFGEDSARLGPTFEGTFAGCLDTVAVDVYLTTAGPQVNSALAAGSVEYLRPELVIDGRSVFNAVPTGHAVTAVTVPGDVPMYRLRFAFTGIDAVMRALPHAFAARDGVHEVRLTVTPHSVSIEDAVFVYDAADAPAGLTFNASDVAASGRTIFAATTNPDPQRGAGVDTACRFPVADATRGDNPVGNVPCPGVRPGAFVLIEGGGGCSLNFMFTARTAQGTQRRFMGTAGHCLLAAEGQEAGQQVWAPGDGPIVSTGDITGVTTTTGEAFGRLVYARLDGLRDFALIELDAGVVANPQMCYWGGPTGIDHDLRPGPVTVRQFGQGLVYGDTIPARTGVAAEWRDPDFVYYHSVSLPGDSGSGVITDEGRAVGTLVHEKPAQSGDGYIGVIRIKPAMDDAIAALGLVSWELESAPRLQ